LAVFSNWKFRLFQQGFRFATSGFAHFRHPVWPERHRLSLAVHFFATSSHQNFPCQLTPSQDIHMRRFLLFATLSFSAPAMAADNGEIATGQIRAATTQLLETLGEDVKIAPAARPEVVREVLGPHLDMATASRVVLGPFWLSASKAERDRFARAFESVLINTYAGAIIRAGNPQVRYLTARVRADGVRILVRTKVTLADGREIDVNYRMRQLDGRWRVYDFVVEGISLLATYRADFKVRARKGGIGAVLAHLKAYVAS
jgi:phospholipid transport system substrate-binding protein